MSNIKLIPGVSMVPWMAEGMKAGGARLFTDKLTATTACGPCGRDGFSVRLKGLTALITTKYLLRLLEINVIMRLFRFQSAIHILE